MSEMMYCRHCAMVRAEGEYCWRCGEKLVKGQFACPHCKQIVVVSHSFCPSCGRPIQEEVKEFIHSQNEEGGES